MFILSYKNVIHERDTSWTTVKPKCQSHENSLKTVEKCKILLNILENFMIFPNDMRLIKFKALNFIPWIIDCLRGEFQWGRTNFHNVCVMSEKSSDRRLVHHGQKVQNEIFSCRGFQWKIYFSQSYSIRY